ncbi:hypothetical protein GCM10008995_19750 [Halobellus salinus]|uniref:Aminoglycoside phosphotransferase domain-containing protein n=1 Tax=Halobellus salinus TaxID=931585 RepID=A0A830EP27_9EURY|nr:phosphotransferase [Halobellus salinus]GGJ09877.1 hypothetical protein GCM10008995_19750 [Halobellus salinus]SMP24840.1 Phosphotransferase enzyme family protein [Halobellus salinus]
MGEQRSVDRIAERVRPGAVIDSVESVDVGNRRRTAVVRFADADADAGVIQRSPDPETTRVEAALLNAIGDRTSVPVPTPLGSGSVGGEGWLATHRIRGDDLHVSFTGLDPADQRGVARSFGRYLAEVHDAFRFDAYGPLSVAGGELVVDRSVDPAAGVAGGGDAGAVGGSRRVGGSESECTDDSVGGDDSAATEWGAWLAAFGRASLARLPSEFDAVRADAAAVLDDRSVEPGAVPRLFPWDLRPGNALIADGRITGVLDWEGPLAAGPAVSVAKTEYLVADWYVGRDAAGRLREAVRAGYESVREYPAVRPVHRIAAVASTAVDSRGVVTNPGYPPVSREEAVRFHRRTLEALV